MLAQGRGRRRRSMATELVCRRVCRGQPPLVSVRALIRIGPYSVPGLYQFLLRVAERIAGKRQPKRQSRERRVERRGVKVSSD